MYRELWGLVVVWLLWLMSRALAAQFKPEVSWVWLPGFSLSIFTSYHLNSFIISRPLCEIANMESTSKQMFACSHQYCKECLSVKTTNECLTECALHEKQRQRWLTDILSYIGLEMHPEMAETMQTLSLPPFWAWKWGYTHASRHIHSHKSQSREA